MNEVLSICEGLTWCDEKEEKCVHHGVHWCGSSGDAGRCPRIGNKKRIRCHEVKINTEKGEIIHE